MTLFVIYCYIGNVVCHARNRQRDYFLNGGYLRILVFVIAWIDI
jgi:hypothetical protein